MSIGQGKNGGVDQGMLNDLYRCLQRPERRRILFSLLDLNPQTALMIPKDVHVGEEGRSTLHFELGHNHLPTLTQAGLIRWERDAEEVHKGRNFEQTRELLEAIREHDPVKLPQDD